MKKIFLSLFSLCAATSLWAYDFQSGLLYYNILNGDSTVEVTYESSKSGNYYNLTAVNIPETVTYKGKTYTVVAIGNEAFTDCPDRAVYPSSYSYLNTSLKLVNIPKTVKTIGSFAFECCTALTTINFLGDGLESIVGYAFTKCTALKSFEFPSTLKTIGSNVFSFSALSGSVTIPDNVTLIGSSAFESCSNLTSVTLGNSVTTLYSSVFKSCSSLTSVVLGNSVTALSSNIFESCSSLISVTLGNSIATIGEYAFNNCSSLPSITLPKSVRTIENNAFANCSKLITVYLKPTTPPAFTSTNILPSCAKIFYVPCGASETYFLSDWVSFTTNFQEEECIKKYTIYVNQDCTSSVVEE